MSIAVEGLPSGAIWISGDVETLLIAPYARRGDPFVLGFSDGTLVGGQRDGSGSAWRFRTMVEGAGIVSAEDANLKLDWRVEWATIAPSSGVALATGRDRMTYEFDPVGDDFHVGSIGDWLRRRHVSPPSEAMIPSMC
jgi:hypothetical protein